jgi:hypothetical protein
MAVEGGPDIVDSGLALAFDGANVRSFRGVPTTNAISNADTMASWTLYYRTTAASTFTTEFGTTGYRFTNQPSWNGIYRNFNLGSSGNYTFSAWFRYNGGSSNNNGATVYVSNYGGGDTAVGVDKGLIGVWQRISHTVNVTSPSNVYFYLISYGGTDNGTGNPDYSSWEVTMPQIEAGTTLTPFVNGTRGTTNATGGGWVDLSGNGRHGQLFNGPTFNSANGGGIVLDGSNDYIEASTTLTTNRTVEIIYKMNSTGQSWGPLFRTDWYERIFPSNITIINANGVYYTLDGPQDNTNIQHICYTAGGTSLKSYRNGQLLTSTTMNGNLNTGNYSFNFGYQCGGSTCAHSNCTIYSIRMYDIQLTDAQVLQNFNAQRKRFGI